MLPAVLFAGDDETIVGGPVENAAAGFVGHVGKRVLRSCATVPDFAGVAGGCCCSVGDPDGPGMWAVRLDEIALRGVARLRRAADEGDAGAIERPLRIGVAVDAGREEGDGFLRHVIYADEGVIAAAGDEGEARAIW